MMHKLLHAQRAKQAQSVTLRKQYLERTYLEQIGREKQMIISKIARLQPAARKLFLEERLKKISTTSK